MYAMHYNTWYVSESQTDCLNNSKYIPSHCNLSAMRRQVEQLQMCKPVQTNQQASSLLWRAMRCNEDRQIDTCQGFM